MSAAGKQSDSLDGEFEIDLTGENELKPADQRNMERQQTSSAPMTGSVEYRDKKVSVRIDDLSIGGVGISMDSRLPLNEECKLTIQLSVCGSDYELAMKCRVRHCDKVNNKTYEAGLQFIDMAQSTRDTLKLLIR
jgi:c-di-GMP-binding flagellar brake protein YcgR